jgi:hypothetical protein
MSDPSLRHLLKLEVMGSLFDKNTDLSLLIVNIFPLLLYPSFFFFKVHHAAYALPFCLDS